MNRGLKAKSAFLLIGLIICFLVYSSGSGVLASDYGVGDYGECPYSAASTTCDIAISNNGFSLILNVTPSISGSCTIQSDQVTVSTYDPSGYSLTLGNINSSANLTNSGSNYISPTSGTLSSPIALSNAWGYRVDALDNFGAGPTSAETNAAPNGSILFAQTEPSGNPPDTIAQTSTLDTSVPTTVWYGVCLSDSAAIPPGGYSSIVQYTATAN